MVLPSNAMTRQFATGKSVIEGQSNIMNQAVAAEFIKQGHFARHIRRMRLLYKKAQDELVSLINLHLKNKLAPAPVEAGMHLVAWLRPGLNAEIIANEASKERLIIHSISQYSIEFKHAHGIILGFSGFTFGEMEAGVLLLKKVLDIHCGE